MPMLSYEQARFFRTTGYYRLLNVFNAEQTSALRAFVMQEKQGEEARHIRVERARTIKLYGLYDRSPDLIQRVLANPTLLGALESILGPNIVFVKNRHNHATVNDNEGTESESRLHRDVLQPTRGLITAALYLENSTLENGCTHIVPSSQVLPYVGVPQPNGGGTWMDEHEEYEGLLDQALPVPMPEGGVLLFDGLAFHGVGVNNSDKTRISMTFGFRSADELDRYPDPERQVLIAGEYIYRGNDRQ